MKPEISMKDQNIIFALLKQKLQQLTGHAYL